LGLFTKFGVCSTEERLRSPVSYPLFITVPIIIYNPVFVNYFLSGVFLNIDIREWMGYISTSLAGWEISATSAKSTHITQL
jgi:hypothetical protein